MCVWVCVSENGSWLVGRQAENILETAAAMQANSIPSFHWALCQPNRFSQLLLNWGNARNRYVFMFMLGFVKLISITASDIALTETNGWHASVDWIVCWFRSFTWCRFNNSCDWLKANRFVCCSTYLNRMAFEQSHRKNRTVFSKINGQSRSILLKSSGIDCRQSTIYFVIYSIWFNVIFVVADVETTLSIPGSKHPREK